MAGKFFVRLIFMAFKKKNMKRNKKDILKLIKLAEREIREWQKVLARLKEQLKQKGTK